MREHENAAAARADPRERIRRPVIRAGTIAVAALLAAAGTWLGAAAARGDDAATTTKRNVVLIISSDQRADTLQWMPNLRRRVASVGVTFETAIAVSPGGDPGLAGILSGRRASAHGVIKHGGGNAFAAGDTLATRLHAAGYATAFVGKYFDGYQARAPYPAPGWEVWDAFVEDPASSGLNTLYYGYSLTGRQGVETHGIAPADYSTDVLARRAVDLVATLDEPFLLVVAPFAPRYPAIPAPRHGDASEEAGIAPARGGNVDDKPQYVRNRRAALEPDRTASAAGPSRSTDRPAGAAAYAALISSVDRRRELQSLRAIDEAVGSILGAVASRGLTDRTIVVYTATTGRLRGEHWGWTSDDPYEAAVRIPLVVSLPGRTPTQSASDDVAANIDIRPTIEAAAGLAGGERIDGVSLLPSWSSQTIGRSALLLEGWSNAPASRFAAPDFRGVRTADSKYLRYADGFEELYDLAADADESRNLAVDQTHRPELERMRARLRTSIDAAESGRPRFRAVADAGFVRDEAPWFRRPFDLVAADMDVDGDPDVLINWHHHEPLELYENRDGRFVLRNARGADTSGLYDNPGIPYLFADGEEMAAKIEKEPISGLAIWHDLNRGGFWRFAWHDGRARSKPVRIELETTFPPIAIEGLEDAEMEHLADNRLRVTLAPEVSDRHFAVRVLRVATELSVAIDGEGSGTSSALYVGSELTRIDGNRVDLWKPDPHGIAWVDVEGSERPEIYITRGGLGGELVAPLGPKHDRYFVATDANPPLYEPAAEGTVPAGYTRGRRVEWVDVDGDGTIELWVAGEKTPALLLGREQAGAALSDRAAAYGLDLPDAAISTWGDLEADGYPDLFVLDGQRIDVWRNRRGLGFDRIDGRSLGLVLPEVEPRPGVIEPAALRVSDFDDDGDLDLWVHAYGKNGVVRLFRNEGASGYVDTTAQLGLDAARGSDAVVLLDVDDDGFEDAVSLGPRSMLWQNHGGRHFTIAPLAVETETGRLFAAAAADVDGDGRTDLIAAGRRRSYLRNETAAAGNHSLEVQLRGRTGEPVGAIVSAHYDDGSVHAQRYGSAHSSAFSQSLLPLHFGIPAGRELTEISVVWPGGERTASVAVQSGSTRLVIDAPAAADPTRTTPAATRATEPLDGR